jgi:hypothetical protein
MAGLIRLVSIVASLVVLGSFALFAIDQSQAASNESSRVIAGEQATAAADPTPREEKQRERIHTKPREAVDDADDVLLKPFAWADSGTGSEWARRGVPTLLALLVYFFGLGYLARLIRLRS